MTDARRLWLWAGLLTAGWVTVFTGHNRWIAEWLRRSDVFVSWGDVLRGTVFPVFVLLLIVSAILTLGFWALRALKLHNDAALSGKTVLAFAFGAGLLCLIHILLGAMGVLRASILWPVYLSLGFLGFWRFRTIRLPAIFWTPYRLVITSFLVWGLGNTALQSLMPPTEIDTVAHHFAHIRIWADAGRFVFLPWMMHANWPMVGELLYLGPITLGFDTVAQGLHWSFGFFLVLGLLRFGRGRFSFDTRLTAAALYATFPIVTHYMGTGHNDQVWAFFLLAAFYLLTQSQGQTRRLVAAGLLGGLAAGCRYHAMFAAGCLFIAAFLAPTWFSLRRRDALLAAASATLLVIPWLIKNAWLLGNPVWPLLYPVFGGDFWSGEVMSNYIRICQRSMNPLHWLSMEELRHFWRPTVSPHASHYFLWPLALLFIGKRTSGVSLWKAALLWYALYCPVALIFETNWLRFSMPWLALGALYFADRVAERKPFGLVLLAIAFIPALTIRFYEPDTALLGLRDVAHPERSARDAYLARASAVWDAHRMIEARTPETARVLLFREISGYGLRREYRWGDPVNQGIILYDRLADAPALYQTLKALGITHVLDYPPAPLVSVTTGLSYYSRHVLDLMAATLARYGHRIADTHGYVLWELP